jgi:hypothetical protein
MNIALTFPEYSHARSGTLIGKKPYVNQKINRVFFFCTDLVMLKTKYKSII